MNIISKKDRDELYMEVMSLLGAPVSTIEIDNKTFDIHLSIAIKDYSSYINNWLVEQQFPSLQGLNVDSADITLAMTTKTLDFEQSFSDSYSKQFGLGNSASSKWELKKDYITVSANTQTYLIPAGREINEVLWVTPPSLSLSNPTYSEFIPGGMGWYIGNTPLQSILPSSSMILFAQDWSQKRKLTQSELTYKIAGGPNGTKRLFLFPIPGSSDEMALYGMRHYEGAKVFYWYYETNEKGRKKCLEQNSDVIKTPNDIPINNLSWNQLNETSKTRVRKLLHISLLRFLSINRGKFSGEIDGPNGKTLKLDYNFLDNRANTLETALYEEINKSLENLSYEKMMEMRKNISNNLVEIAKNIPSKVQYLWM